MDFKAKIPEIEKKIKYSFKDKSLLAQAFTRASYCNEKNFKGRNNYQSNEVLEFFGDSVLSTAIITLFLENKTERYEHGISTELDEGDFSNIRSKLSDKKNLARLTSELGLEKYLILGEGDEKLGIGSEPSVMEDLFESIIGAVYIDSNMDMKRTVEVVKGMLDISLYLTPEKTVIQSYKNALQEWCADKKHRLPQPLYKTVSESGPDHKKTYERGCYIGDKLYGVGRGKNQKLADAEAAEITLEMLKKEALESRPKGEDPLVRLRLLAREKKAPSPEFRDLGESPASTASRREYIIECRALGIIQIGVGNSKSEARESAAENIITAIKKAEKPKKIAKKANITLQSKLKELKKNSATVKKSIPKKTPMQARKKNT